MSKKLRQKTKKLFYNQYPFKVATLVKGGGRLRFWNVEYIVSSQPYGFHNASHRLTDDDQERLRKFSKPFNRFKKKSDSVKIRYEGSHVNFFLKDRKEYEAALKAFKEFVVESWETESDAETDALMGNNKIVIVNQLPHGVYTHKVIFKSMPIDKKASLLSWLKKYPTGEFKISPTTELYLNNTRMWKQDPFVLVKEPKMLTMMSLSMGDYIRRTEKYVLRSSINTGSQD